MKNFKQELFQQLMENLPVNVYWKDVDLKYVGCNSNMATNLGYKSPAEIIGLSDSMITQDPEQVRILEEHDKKVLASDKAIQYEEPGTTKGEVNSIFFTQKIPLHSKDGKADGILGISIDITDRKKIQELEQKLAITQERLKVAQLMSASIAHEVRTPLARLAMELDEVKDYAKTKDAALALPAKNIEGALDSAHHIIEMLLLKSKANKLKITDQFVLSLKTVIDEALHEYPFKKGQLELVNIQFDEDFKFNGNAFYFKHIIFNLLKNSFYAIQKAQKGKISITVNSRARTLIFEDTACGIPEDILPHIFDSFYTQSERGTGVGLALSKQIMEEFNGTFECATELGKFTRFTMSFPSLNSDQELS